MPTIIANVAAVAPQLHELLDENRDETLPGRGEAIAKRAGLVTFGAALIAAPPPAWIIRSMNTSSSVGSSLGPMHARGLR